MTAIWPYESSPFSGVYAPYIWIVIKNATESKKYPREEECQALFDTGYDGYLAIPLSIFETLGLQTTEVPPEDIPIAQTLSGDFLQLRTARGKIEVPILAFSKIIEIDTNPAFSEIIVGRSLLEDFILHLHGKKRELNLEITP